MALFFDLRAGESVYGKALRSRSPTRTCLMLCTVKNHVLSVTTALVKLVTATSDNPVHVSSKRLLFASDIGRACRPSLSTRCLTCWCSVLEINFYFPSHVSCARTLGNLLDGYSSTHTYMPSPPSHAFGICCVLGPAFPVALTEFRRDSSC